MIVLVVIIINSDCQEQNEIFYQRRFSPAVRGFAAS